MAERYTRVDKSSIKDIAPSDITANATNSPSDGQVPSKATGADQWNWVDASGTPLKIQDGDADTLINTEETTDKDEIVAKVAGTEALRIYTNGIIDLPKQSSCSVSRSSTSQTISTGTWTKLQFNTEAFDIQSEFDSSTNYRFTATKAGIYLISATVSLQLMNAGNEIGLQVYKNGSALGGNWTYAYATNIALRTMVMMSVSLAATEYIEIYTWHNKGSDLVTSPYANLTFCTILKVA